MSKHTKGPLKIKSAVTIPASIVASNNYRIAYVEELTDAHLLVAAYNSYDKHCGDRAVECAEGDLLGEALQVCKCALADLAGIMPELEPSGKRQHPGWQTIVELKAVLAKAEGIEHQAI